MAGIGSFSDVAMLNNPDLQGEPLATLQAAMDPIDPIHYIGHAAPSAVFFQFGTNDTIFKRLKFLDFSHAAGDPKLILWYEADHYLDTTARNDRIEWLSINLNLLLKPS